MDTRAWLPADDATRVVVSCTARRNGSGPRPLPTRFDHDGPIAALMVEDPDDAAAVFSALDRPGRTIYVDVERKQPADLMDIALRTVRQAQVSHAKPNDATARSADVVLTHYLGPQLFGRRIGLVGVGNLGFKIALAMAERNASVYVRDIRPEAVAHAVDTIGFLLPRYCGGGVAEWTDQRVDTLITCSAKPEVIDADTVDLLEDGSFILDVGINNLVPAAVKSALSRGMDLVRLDTRADGQPVPSPAPGFFDTFFGTDEFDGVPVASGGIVGERGTVVVDAVGDPHQVIGVANGVGGILPVDQLTPSEKERLTRVTDHVRLRQASL